MRFLSFNILIFLTAALSVYAESVSEIFLKGELDRISRISDSDKRLKEYDALAQIHGRPAVKSEKQWNIFEETDPFDDSRRVMLSLKAYRTTSSYRPAYLYIRFNKDKYEVFISSEEYLADNNQIVYRFDKEKAKTENWQTSTDQKALFCPGPVKFIQSIIKSRELAVKIYPYNDNTVVAQFNIEGLKKIIEHKNLTLPDNK